MPYLNRAAWLPEKSRPLVISAAPHTKPGAGEILVRNRAIAINPFDGVVQKIGKIVTPWLNYPAVLGTDVAGEVVAVGTAVTRFNVGDRVVGLARGTDKVSKGAPEGAFQNYTLLQESAVSTIPSAITFEQAAVLPLGICTAATGLFMKDQLALALPSAGQHRPSGKAVLIWGGSTSVGSCAIQLAVAAGYEVVTTASPANFDYVRRLGATSVFDYRDRNVVAAIVQHLSTKEVAGALAIGSASATPCIRILSKCRGRKFMAMTNMPVAVDDAPLDRQFLWKLKKFPRMGVALAVQAIRARLHGVSTGAVWGTALIGTDVGRAIFVDFLGDALADGRLVPAPDPLVAGNAIDDIPHAMEVLRRGVSARKVVVSLGDAAG